MLKIIIPILLLISVVLVSGCTQPAGDGTGQIISKQTEDQAAAAIESELDQAVSDIDIQDIENALTNL